MRILVVDDERCYGSLLASACKKLGHRGLVTQDAERALAVLAREVIDLAILDIEMPEMSGLELAARLQVEVPGLPIAFCAGSAGPDDVAKARRLGPVLPKVWTIADLRVVLQMLRAPRRTPAPPATSPVASPPSTSRAAPAASTSPPPAASADELARGSGPVAVPQRYRRETLGSVPGAPREKLRVSCRSWDRLRRLCADHLEGQSVIAVRVRQSLEPGTAVNVALELPDEMTVLLSGLVIEKGVAEGARTEHRIDLAGFDRESAFRLLSMADAHDGDAGDDDTPAIRPAEVAGQTDPDGAAIDDLDSQA